MMWWAAASWSSGAAQTRWKLGGHFVEIAVPGTTGDTGLDDLDGRYHGLMDALGCDVLLKRPDFYLFGACRRSADLPALIQDMRAQLGR